MASIDSKRQNKVPIEEKPKQLFFFVIKNMEMFKYIWNIRPWNENIYDTDIKDALLLTWNIKNILKTLSFNQEKSAHCYKFKSQEFHTLKVPQSKIHQRTESFQRLQLAIRPSCLCKDFNFYYIHFDTPILGSREITWRVCDIAGTWTKATYTLNKDPDRSIIFPLALIYIIQWIKKNLSPTDKYQCRKSTVQWDYNPGNFTLPIRR